MRNFLPLFPLVLALAFASSATAQEAQRTLVKSFNPEGQQHIVLMLNGPVEIREWSDAIVRVQMNITAEDINESVLKSLITAGRYNLSGEVKDGSFVIHTPNLAKTVTIRGQELKDTVSFIVNVPARSTVQIHEQAASSVESVPSSTLRK